MNSSLVLASTLKLPSQAWRSALLWGLDLLLMLKLLAFFPSNFWLWRYGPNVAARVRAELAIGNLNRPEQRDLYVRDLENNGSVEVTIADAEFDKLPRLRFVRPGRSERFRKNHVVSYYLVNVASSTPFLIAFVSILAIPISKHAYIPPVVTAVALLTAIATFTLVAAPITRMVLGSFDVHSAGLQPYVRVFRRKKYPSLSGERDGLVIYFLGLFLLSTLTYSVCYNLLYMLQMQQAKMPPHVGHEPFTAFHIDHGSPNLVTWIYFSAITVATVGYGDISPDNHWAQLVVVFQVMSGPFLLTWLLTIALSGRSTEA